MEVRPGYKQTELGVFPEGWELKPFGDLFDFSGGVSASRDQLSETGHCYLHYGDIHGATKTCVDTHADFQDIPKLDIPLKKVSPRSLLEDGDIVFVDASEDDEGTSRHVIVVNKGNLPFISGLHTIVAKSKTDELTHEYRRYCFQTAAIKRQFRFYAVGTKVSGISKSNIPKLLLPFPKPPEQRAIAAALSDVDALLGGLDRLIAKKRDLKQAAMQQLLTGRTRLPGFSGEWEVRAIRDVVSTPITDGPHLTPKFLADGIPFLSVNNLVNNRIDLQSLRFVSKADHLEFSKKCKPRKGDILFGKAASVGMVALIETDMELNIWSPLALIRVDPPASARFVYYALQANQVHRQIKLLTNSSSQGNIGMVEIGLLEIPLPAPDEQTAIASALSDMDAELAALEARRNKTRDLKQAMMQELLTGNTRLVPAGAAHA